MLTNHSQDPTPVYFKLQMEIKRKIEDGQWAPQENIPTEKQLSELYKLSPGTVKKALLNLVNEGYLYRVQGKGTFVAGTTLRRGSIRYYRLQKDFRDDQIDLRVKLVQLKNIKAVPKYNSHLQISADENLYQLKRLFLYEDKPVIYAVSYIPANMFPDLEKHRDDFTGTMTFYELLEKEYGITTVSNKKMISTQTVDKKKAALLDIEPGKHLLFVEMLSFTYKSSPYEYRETFCLTDEHKLVVLI